jgi:phosphoglycerate kinase
MARFKTLDDLDFGGRRVLLRVDFNVPMRDGQVGDTTRIERCLPTIRELSERGARVAILSHFGRPKGRRVAELSLAPIAAALSRIMGGREIAFAEDCIGPAAEGVVGSLHEGDIAMLENLRFHGGEEANDPDFAAALAGLGDLYVNDAFAVSHRAHASVAAIALLLPAAAGRLMQAELENLTAALETPERPVAVVVGGAKVSTKLDLLGNLLDKADALMIGGGMANTFLHALGLDVGKSLCEPGMAEKAREILERARARQRDILLPSDAVVAETLKAGAAGETVGVKHVPPDKMILDLGPATVETLGAYLETCATLVWNGPLGCFETAPFDAATNALARKAAELTKAGRLRSVAGGGDTVAALAHAGVLEDFSYVSTAGGAFLEWLEGKTLPGVKALEDAAL